MRNKLTTRNMARQNLLVATVKAALEQGLITLECEPVESAEFEFVLGSPPPLTRGRVRER